MNKEEFVQIVNEFINHEKVLEMKKYRQHFDIDCYEHCYHVAETCYKIAKKLNLDYVSVTRAAMVHDMFLYDWHIRNDGHNLHAFSHGKKACENASKYFNLSAKEKDMITKHMWPVILALPRSKEGFILTIADKYCATKECLDYISKKVFKEKVLKYGTLVLQILLLKK